MQKIFVEFLLAVKLLKVGWQPNTLVDTRILQPGRTEAQMKGCHSVRQMIQQPRHASSDPVLHPLVHCHGCVGRYKQKDAGFCNLSLMALVLKDNAPNQDLCRGLLEQGKRVPTTQAGSQSGATPWEGTYHLCTVKKDLTSLILGRFTY